MTIAHDTATVATAYTSTGTQTTSHAGSASTKAVVVLIDQNGSTADQVSGVTYGGTAMKRLDTNSESTEAGRVYTYYLINPPTGTQDVAMTTTGTANKQLVCATMTGSAYKTIKLAGGTPWAFTGTSASTSNPSWNITGLTAGVKLVAYEVIHSGLQTMTTTPATGWTLISSTDLGSQGRGFAYQSVGNQSGTTLACGWIAATADDYVGNSVAFYEDANLINKYDGPPTVSNDENTNGENSTVGDWAGNSVFGGFSPDTVTNSSAQSHSGTRSILGTHVTDGTKQGNTLVPVFGVLDATRYTFTLWAWVPTGSADVYGIALLYANTPSTSTKDAWVSLSRDFIMDSSGLVFIGAFTDTAAVTGQTVYVDDVTMYATDYLDGTGTLTATGTVGKSTGSALVGTGTLTATGSRSLSTTATLAGTGSLAATGLRGLATTATLAGTGTLAATATVAKSSDASLAGTGTLTGTGAKGSSTGATLAGTGTLTASGIAGLDTGATVAGTGTLTTTGTVGKATTATLAGTGTLTATGSTSSPGTSGDASRTGTGTLAATGVTGTSTGATLTATGSLTATATTGLSTGATLAGTGTLVAAAIGALFGNASLSGTASLLAAADTGTSTTATLSGSGTLTATGTVIVVDTFGDASLTGVGTLTATGTAAGPISTDDVTVLSVTEAHRAVTITDNSRRVTITDNSRRVTITDNSRRVTITEVHRRVRIENVP